MRKIAYLLAFTFIILVAACQKELKIDIPDSEARLVLNGMLVQDSVISINVSKSQSVLNESDTLDYIENADVEVFENGSSLGKLQHSSLGWYKLLNSSVKAGTEYRFVVSISGRNIVESTTEVPFSESTITTSTTLSNNQWGDKEYLLNIKINDKANSVNYYSFETRLRFWSSYTDSDTGELLTDDFLAESYFYSEDPAIISSRNISEIAISDNFFDGRSYNFTGQFRVHYYGPDSMRIYTDFKEISKSYYLYLSSLSLYYDAQENPLAEPVQIYTNVKGGLGLVASSTLKIDSITVPGIAVPDNWK